MIDEVTGLVALPRFNNRNLGRDSRFENVFGIAEFFGLLAFGELRSETGASIKSGNSGAARA